MKHHNVFFRCTRVSEGKPVVVGVAVRDGIVTRSGPYFRRHVGLPWRDVRHALEIAGWDIEEVEDPQP